MKLLRRSTFSEIPNSGEMAKVRPCETKILFSVFHSYWSKSSKTALANWYPAKGIHYGREQRCQRLIALDFEEVRTETLKRYASITCHNYYWIIYSTNAKCQSRQGTAHLRHPFTDPICPQLFRRIQRKSRVSSKN